MLLCHLSKLVPQTIQYNNKTSITLQGLLSVSKISDEGDSGAVATTNRGEVIGMVIGGDDTYSYLVPIRSILKRLEIEICE